MPTPIPPSVFKDLIPRANASLCGKFIPSISDFIRRFADYYEYVYDADGNFTDAFKNDLCALGCGGQVILPTCPNSIYINNISGQNDRVILDFTVNGELPFDYAIYRATSDSGPWGEPIANGTATSSTITYQDSNVVPNQRYFYKIEITKSGCDLVSITTPGVRPMECYVIASKLLFGAEAEGGNAVKLTLRGTDDAPIPDGATVNIHRSTMPDVMGDVIVYKATISNNFFEYQDSGLTPSTAYYYTAYFKQSQNCDALTLTTAIYVQPPPLLPAPVIQRSTYLDHEYWWQEQDGIVRYIAFIVSACGGGEMLRIRPDLTPLNGVVRGLYPNKEGNIYKVIVPNTYQLNCVGGSTYNAPVTQSTLSGILPGSSAWEYWQGRYVPPYQRGPAIIFDRLSAIYYLYVIGYTQDDRQRTMPGIIRVV